MERELTLVDKLKCECGQVSPIGEMEEEFFNNFPNPEGGIWKAFYRRCRACGTILAYEPGDGTVRLSNPQLAEIVK